MNDNKEEKKPVTKFRGGESPTAEQLQDMKKKKEAEPKHLEEDKEPAKVKKGDKKKGKKADPAKKAKLEKEYLELKAQTYDLVEERGLEKPDGKIQVGEEEKTKKYLYYIVRLPEDKCVDQFDWKVKGLVRKRFEAIRSETLLRKEDKMKEAKSKLEDIKEQVSTLEELVGPMPEMKKALNEQYKKLVYLRKPEVYYKDLFNLLNKDDLYKSQVDVRSMPTSFAYKKVNMYLKAAVKYLVKRREKGKKSENILFAVLCSGRLHKNKPQEEEKEGEKQSTSLAVPLMVHRLLKDKFEYVFFADQAGKRETGVFIVNVTAPPAQNESD